MNSKVLNRMVALVCLAIVIGCAAPGPRVPIIKPQLIGQEAAKEKLIPAYCDLVAQTDRRGFEIATGICRRVKSGELQPAGVKSSANGRYALYLFKEKATAGVPSGDRSVIAFSFNPGSEVVRSCDQGGLCDVHVRQGETRFGFTNVDTQGEPTVNDNGITVKYSEIPRSYAFALLFSYGEKNKREGDALIAIFLSAFPMVDYQ